jgi:transaldolase
MGYDHDANREEMDMNPLRALKEQGQAVWMDFIRRDLLIDGELERLVGEDGLSGVTSNPAIFQKAIGESSDYDEQLRRVLAADPEIAVDKLFEELAVRDIRMAADILRSTWEATSGADGFVSLEVSPHLAGDTQGTMDEARRLWATVDRPNLMIKVPATAAGIPAIEELLAEGLNINITLMFSMAHYEAVTGAYLRALKRCLDPSRVASVASFFVSRVDTKLDKALEEVGTDEALELRGTLAVANSKLTYRRFREIFHGEPFAGLRERGARVQRVLWASTSTKNPAYRDVLYVEELIGPETVNTMPPDTVEAFRDHGTVGPTLEVDLEEAEARLGRLAALGIDLDRATEELQQEGVEKFAQPFDKLLATLDDKRQQMLAAVAAEPSE